MWDPQVPAFAQNFRVVRYDQRGHGRSATRPGPCTVENLGHDLLGVLDGLGVAQAHVCGLSLGGMVALWLATRAPERLDRLILCCTAAELGPPGPWDERAVLVRAQGTSALFETLLPRWLPAGGAPAPEIVEGIREGLASCSGETYA